MTGNKKDAPSRKRPKYSPLGMSVAAMRIGDSSFVEPTKHEDWRAFRCRVSMAVLRAKRAGEITAGHTRVETEDGARGVRVWRTA